MPGRFARNTVRGLVTTALLAALLGSALAPVPAELPATALGQPALYRLEITLLVFYGCLLVITPAFLGLASGRLPVEISTKGARFADEASRTVERDKSTIEELEKTTERLEVGLAAAMSKLGQFERQRDNR